MARMTRPTYEVWTRTAPGSDDETETLVEIEWADQLRGELEAGKYGIDTSAPMNLTTVWIWCAMTRLKLTSLGYPAWKAGELVGLAKRKDPETGETIADPEVPPTTERSGSVSDSLSPTPAPPSSGGSQPTSA